MKAQIHQITWDGKSYYKVYAENLNGRMILISKTKFNDLKDARKLVKVMLPTYTLDRKIKEVQL